MLPIDEQSKLSDHHQEWDHHDIHRTEEQQPVNHQAEPPRYLDPTTYQPIAQPQPGQLVFDTEGAPAGYVSAGSAEISGPDDLSADRTAAARSAGF